MHSGYMTTEMVEVATGKVVRREVSRVYMSAGHASLADAVKSLWNSTVKSYRRGKYICRLVGYEAA